MKAPANFDRQWYYMVKAILLQCNMIAFTLH